MVRCFSGGVSTVLGPRVLCFDAFLHGKGIVLRVNTEVGLLTVTRGALVRGRVLYYYDRSADGCRCPASKRQ